MNTQHPNSQNTTLISIFETDDSTTNVYTVLNMYKTPIAEMQGMQLKYATIIINKNVGSLWDHVHKLHIPTIEFPGRHNCLWCLIPSSSLKVPLAVRGGLEERSLDSLKSDHSKFLSNGGGDIRKVKFFNNVIDYFFNIPVENVTTCNIYNLHKCLFIY